MSTSFGNISHRRIDRLAESRKLNIFLVVLARGKEHVEKKVRELERLGIRYLVICGEPMALSRVIYRPPKGKYDAINFGVRQVPKDVDIVILNDVDTTIHDLNAALCSFEDPKVGLVFARVVVREGPQRLFYVLMNSLRKRVMITSSGELMLVRRALLTGIVPMKPCKTEDNYILFRILQKGYRAIFCEDCFVETERTKTALQEQTYKRKTVTGLYQALSYCTPPIKIRVFYLALPLLSPLLVVLGKKGYYWAKGIILGFLDYLRGDRSGVWATTYKE